jgi:hypothetical protein
MLYHDLLRDKIMTNLRAEDDIVDRTKSAGKLFPLIRINSLGRGQKVSTCKLLHDHINI